MIYLVIYENEKMVHICDNTGFENTNFYNRFSDSPMVRLPLLNTLLRYKKPTVVAIETELHMDDIKDLSYSDAITYGETIYG